MAYTALQLISKAYYLSQVVTNGYETISGSQLDAGLDLLNEILSMESADNCLIPYFSSFDFTCVIGQETYSAPNFITVDTLTFYNGVVRYSSDYVSRRNYFGAGRVENITTLPFTWHFERVFDGCTIYLYPLPSLNFPVTVWGKYGLTKVEFNNDLSTVYDLFYLKYLRYKLAEAICEETGVTFQAAKALLKIEITLRDVSTPDLTLTKMSSFTGTPALNWGDVNIGKGYRPC